MDKQKVGAQTLGRRLVEQHVLACFNSLVRDLDLLLQEAPLSTQRECSIDPEDLLTLMGGRVDYREAATQEHWETAEQHEGLWDYVFLKFEGEGDAEAHLGVLGWEATQVEGGISFLFKNHRTEGDPFLLTVGDAVISLHPQECHVLLVEGDFFEDGEEAAWLELGRRLGITQFASDTYQVDGNEDEAWEDLCEYARIDADDYRSEVFEYWAVSDWLGHKLKERGEIAVEMYGATVWGRCTTGQAILLDGVIRDIALAEWPDEFDGSEY